MSEIVKRLVDEHISLGGYAVLMSARLGETLRAKIEGRLRVDTPSAAARQYPLVSTPNRQLSVQASGRRTTTIVIENRTAALIRARQVAGNGEAVLWIRSTVGDASAFQSSGTPVMPHHSRFADVDRRYLDQKVLQVIGVGGIHSGIVIVGTQTLEQSLDIDADLLVSDTVPADVFLQRLGRLHRHRAGTTKVAVILEPGDCNCASHRTVVLLVPPATVGCGYTTRCRCERPSYGYATTALFLFQPMRVSLWS
jgi:CRISPR-associated endonuclease/helicase Cas3